MITVSYFLPSIIAIVCVAIIMLLLIPTHRLKLVRLMSVVIVSLMLIPIFYLFTQIVIHDNNGLIEWSMLSHSIQFLNIEGTVSMLFELTLAVDLFTVWMLLATTIVALTVVLLGHYIKTRQKSFYILSLSAYLMSLIIIMGTHAWTSLIGLMLMAIIIFFMVGIWSKSTDYSFATRFIFMQSIGFVCIAISLFLVQFVVTNYEVHALILRQDLVFVDDYRYMSISQIGYRNLAVILMLVGVACLLPLVGFHRVIVDLFKHAHYAVLVIVAGLYLPLIAFMTKNYLYVLFVDYIPSIKPYMIVACVIHIAFMAISLWKVNQTKQWSGYLVLVSVPIVYILLVSEQLVTVSFAHMGMISMMLTAALLLSVMASLNERQKVHTLDELRGLFNDKPYLASTIVLTFLAVIGFPVFSQFLTLFHTFYAVYDFNVVLFIICTIAVCLMTINVFLHITKLFDKQMARLGFEHHDLRFVEIVPHIILASLVLVLGIYPSVFLEQMEDYVVNTLEWVYAFEDVIIWDTRFYFSLLVGDSIHGDFTFGLAALSIVTLIITMWLTAKQDQRMLAWVLWTASHFASVGLSAFVINLDIREVTLWKQFGFYSITVILIYTGTHFLLSRHMKRSKYESAVHYEGLYYKKRWMHLSLLCLVLAIIGLPFTAMAWLRFELIAQLFIARYIMLAVIILLSFVFVLRPLWYWLAYTTFPIIDGKLLNKNEQIEDWKWTNAEKYIVIGAISINTVLGVIYILL